MMTRQDDRGTQTVLLRLPCYWYRVVAHVENPSALDSLSEAVLRLVRAGEESADGLAIALGDIPADLTTSALRDLARRGLVVERAPRCWMPTPDGGETGVSEWRGGWMAYSEIEQAFVPQLFLPGDLDPEPQSWGRSPWGFPSRDMELLSPVEDKNLGSCSLTQASPDELPRLLRMAVRNGVDVFSRFGDSMHVTSLQHEVRGDGAPFFERGWLWVVVEFLPSLTGEVVELYREPLVVWREDDPRPVSKLAGSVLANRYAGLEGELVERRDRLKETRSVVLRLAGIADVKSLDDMVEAHRRETAHLLGPVEWERLEPELRGYMREAHRWLLIAKGGVQFVGESRLRLGLAFERCAQLMASSVRSSVETAYRRYGGLEGDEAKRRRLKERFDVWQNWVGAAGGISLATMGGHVSQLLTRGGEDLQRIATASNPGLRDCLTRFGLGLAFGEGEEVQRHREAVVAALTLEPDLFHFMDALADMRNKVSHAGHENEDKLSPGRADELLTAVLRALAGYFVVPEVRRELPEERPVGGAAA